MQKFSLPVIAAPFNASNKPLPPLFYIALGGTICHTLFLLAHKPIKYDIHWNPVNTDTKGTCRSVRIIWVSVLSGLSERCPDKYFISARAKGGISLTTKGFFFNVTASVNSNKFKLKTSRSL